MEFIQSVHNPKVKNWTKLQSRKGREAAQSFFIEGVHMVEEALIHGADVRCIMIEDDVELPQTISDLMLSRKIKGYKVSRQIMKKICETENPQGIGAVIGMKEEEPSALLEKTDDRSVVLVLDAIQDPGNLGTMIRTADAAGLKAIVLGTGTVDLYNPKVIRSTMGSVFHVPVIRAELEELLPKMKRYGFQVIAASLEESVRYDESIYGGPVAIVIGNEAKGVSPSLLTHCTYRVKIPIYGQAESLNAAIAAGIIVYEAVRQKTRLS